MLSLAEIQESGHLRAIFAREFQAFVTSLSGLGLSSLQIKTESGSDGGGTEMRVMIAHPEERAFNLTMVVDDQEIVANFSEFHSHYENYSTAEKRPPEKIVEEAMAWIRYLVTADQIVITRLLKGQGVYKKTLEAVHQGNNTVLENIYVGCRGLFFFLPTEKTVVTTSFRPNYSPSPL